MAISIDGSVILGETASSKWIEMSEPTVDGASNLQHPRSEVYVYVCIYIYTNGNYFKKEKCIIYIYIYHIEHMIL